jgi:hypothetical protein
MSFRGRWFRGLLALGFLPLLYSGFLADPVHRELPMSAEALPSQEGPSRLAVLWTSGDREVALNVAFMYTHNAKARGWFDEVTLIVWGPSSRLLSEDEELQEYVVRMEEAGVEVVACRACADTYGVSEILEGMGIEVKYMGEPLTEMLKGDWEILTF